MAVGGLNFGGGFYSAYTIPKRWITTHQGFIYVVGAATGKSNYQLFKISWDGSSLTLEDQADGPADHVIGMYFDLSNNLVVMRQDWTVTVNDMFWYYDTDLNFLGKAEDTTRMLRTWDAAAGGAHFSGNVVFYPGVDGSAVDENPGKMVYDLATQNRYGAGIATEYINNPSFEEEILYWSQQSQLISLALTEQRPMMDWVDLILSHCNGFRHWSEGQLHIGAFKDEASIVSLNQDDLVREEGENPLPPLQIVKRKASDTFNRVEMNWTDRSNAYDVSVALAKDDVDQRVSGKVRINAADLAGIHNSTYAQNQAYRLLFESMYRFSIYTFDVSFKNMLYSVGDVIDVSDGGQIVSQRMRIIGREEEKDGRIIHIQAVEDVSELYPDASYLTQTTLAEVDPQVGASDLTQGTLSFRENAYESRLYLFFAPGDSDTDGAMIYRSYDDVTYLFIGRVVFDKDVSPNSAGTITSDLPMAVAGIHRYDEAFTVDIGEVTTLRTDITDEELFSQQSMCKVGDEIIGFGNAEDQGSGIWRVSNLIRGMFGTGGSAHVSGELFATVSDVDVFYGLDSEQSGQTVYWKALATHGDKVSQALGDVTATSYTILREHERPYPMSIPTVRDNVFGEVSAYPVIVDFKLPSKLMGYNLGGYGEGGWGDFVKDTRLTGVLVTLRTLGGVEISEAYHSLDGYHADDYALELLEADRESTDPIDVILQPVTSLASIKETNVIVDIV
jgi:hypothetical protein